MSLLRGQVPLKYRRLDRAEFGALSSIKLDPDQVERFLGPLSEILGAVQRGPAHSVIAIEAEGRLAGFFVVHPELRDASCWWLGWLALDRNQQGRGYGRAALQAVLERLRGIAGCRRVRLLVAPDNSRACSLYKQGGFREAGVCAATQELILELDLPEAVDPGRLNAFNLAAVAARARRVFRHRRLRLTAGPHAAWVIGVERGPPVVGRLTVAYRRREPSGPGRHRGGVRGRGGFLINRAFPARPPGQLPEPRVARAA